jgi:hypothetical protein
MIPPLTLRSQEHMRTHTLFESIIDYLWHPGENLHERSQTTEAIKRRKDQLKASFSEYKGRTIQGKARVSSKIH